MDNGLLQEPPKWMTSANALSPCPLTLPCRLSRDRAVVGPERREELSELGEEGGAGLQNILFPPVSEILGQVPLRGWESFSYQVCPEG